MTTAGEVITLAHKMLGVLAPGEVLPAADAQDSLDVLNHMLDSWSTEALAIYSTQDQDFTWTANEASRTIGPTGDFVGNRPIKVHNTTYFADGTESFTVKLITERDYNAIGDKTATSTYPEFMFVNQTMPDVTLTVYPVPTDTLTFHIISDVVLAQPAGLTTTLSFPPGYNRAFVLNLAAEIASMYGMSPPPMVLANATLAKRTIKRNNVKKMTLNIDSRLPGMSTGSNIETGI